jgi:hypothetical protein
VDVLLYLSWAEPDWIEPDCIESGESISLPERGVGGPRMEARTPVRVMYACGLVIAGTILFLMIYSGMLEGVGEAIFDFVKEIVKFFIG